MFKFKNRTKISYRIGLAVVVEVVEHKPWPISGEVGDLEAARGGGAPPDADAAVGSKVVGEREAVGDELKELRENVRSLARCCIEA